MTTYNVALALLLTAGLTVGQARADATSEEASRRFKSGVKFYKNGDFTAARVEFQRAYELVPKYDVLFNLGQTARELKDDAAALSAFQRYLDEGGTKVDARRRKDVLSLIEDLTHKVGRIRVMTSVEGAEIRLDDVAVGVAPLVAPLVAKVGRHKIHATRTGYTSVQRMVDVAGTSEITVTLELVPIPAGETPPPVIPAGPVKPELRTAAWMTLAVTSASAVVAAVTGGLAVSAHGDLEQALATFPGDAQAIAMAQARTRGLAAATDVAGALALAGAVTTGVLFAMAPRFASKAAAVEVSAGGIVMRGVF